MSNYLFVLISFFLGVAILVRLRAYDKYEQEDFLLMVGLTLYGGVTSVLVTHFMNVTFASIGWFDINEVLRQFVFVGPIEELSKLLPFLVFAKLFHRKIDEPVDGIIYIGCVALGFSLVENILYAQSAAYLIFARVLIATPMHISVSAIMGFAFSNTDGSGRRGQRVFKAFLLASLLHACNNALAIFEALSFTYFILFFLIWHWVHQVVGYSLLKSPFRKTFKEDIGLRKSKVEKRSDKCDHCGEPDTGDSMLIAKVTVYHCTTCNHASSEEKGVQSLCEYFVPRSKKIIRKNERFANELAELLSGKDSARAFDVEKFDGFLERLRAHQIEKFELTRIYKILYRYF